MPQQNVFSLVGMLALVVLILFLAYWATRWLGRMQAGGNLRAMTRYGEKFCVLAQISLGRNERIVLVRVMERCCLLGVTSEQVTLLRELDEEEAAAWISDKERPAAPGFTEILKENFRKRK